MAHILCTLDFPVFVKVEPHWKSHRGTIWRRSKQKTVRKWPVIPALALLCSFVDTRVTGVGYLRLRLLCCSRYWGSRVPETREAERFFWRAQSSVWLWQWVTRMPGTSSNNRSRLTLVNDSLFCVLNVTQDGQEGKLSRVYFARNMSNPPTSPEWTVSNHGLGELYFFISTC